MLIGGHVSSAGGLVRAIERAEEMGFETMQVFNQSPRAWRPTKYTPADFEAARARLAESTVDSVFIHAVYLINCASPDPEIRSKSLESLAHALRIGDGVEAGGVVLHPGSSKGAPAEKALALIGEALTQVLSESERCPILLENTAGSGDTIGRSCDELAAVIEEAGGDPRLGICLDSCHLLASGHEVRDAGELKSVIDSYDRAVGLERLQCLHLNDSKTALGSNVDRHANLGEGELGKNGIRTFLAEPRFEGLPVLVEVPGADGKGPDREQIEIAKRLREEALSLGA
jgi:deoxyribonuclease-4